MNARRNAPSVDRGWDPAPEQPARSPGPQHPGVIDVAAFLWIAVAPSHLVEAAERMAASRESAFVAAVSGAHNLFVDVACRSASALYEFLTREVGALPDVSAVETVPVARRVKLAGIVMEGELLPEPF